MRDLPSFARRHCSREYTRAVPPCQQVVVEQRLGGLLEHYYRKAGSRL
jgi:hypothetical protein